MEGMKRTTYSQQGVELATLFAAKHSHLEVSGFTPVLRAPSQDSTAGGKQALQHIVLLSRSDGDAVYTMGSVNVATNSAKLRTHDCLRQLHELRFKTEEFPIDPQRYQELFDRLLGFLKDRELVVDIETTPPAPSASLRPAAGHPGTGGTWLFLLALIVGAAGALGYLVMTGQLRLGG